MNIDDTATKAHIDIDDEQRAELEDELNDILTQLDHLKDFEPRQDQIGEDGDLRDDQPVPQSYESTSQHRVDDHIRSPKP